MLLNGHTFPHILNYANVNDIGRSKERDKEINQATIIAIHTGDIANNVLVAGFANQCILRLAQLRVAFYLSYALVSEFLSPQKSSNKILLNMKRLSPNYLRLLFPFPSLAYHSQICASFKKSIIKVFHLLQAESDNNVTLLVRQAKTVYKSSLLSYSECIDSNKVIIVNLQRSILMRSTFTSEF